MTVARRTVAIVNARGLHVRASRRFVELAETFSADVGVTFNGRTVAATSVLHLLELAAVRGVEIEIVADGVDAEAAVEALAGLVDAGFHEDEEPVEGDRAGGTT